MSLGTTFEESKANRIEHLRDAIYYRRKKNKRMAKLCRQHAALEKLNQRYFLGDLPF